MGTSSKNREYKKIESKIGSINFGIFLESNKLLFQFIRYTAGTKY